MPYLLCNEEPRVSVRGLLSQWAAMALLTALGPKAHAVEKPKAAAEPAGESVPAAESAAPEVTDFYVHQWIPLPPFTGSLLGGTGLATLAPTKGRPMVILFLASWCEPCQQLVAGFVDVARRYEKLDTDFVFVFGYALSLLCIGMRRIDCRGAGVACPV